MSFQPSELTDFTQDAVRLGWLQPRFLPPTYTAAAPYRPPFHAFIADSEGAVQVSKARPV